MKLKYEGQLHGMILQNCTLLEGIAFIQYEEIQISLSLSSIF